MKTFQKILALFLCGAILTTPSCSKNGTDTGSPADESTGIGSGMQTSEPQILTNVFRGIKVETDPGDTLMESVKPYRNAETGEIDLLFRRTSGEADEMVRRTIGPDGTAVRETVLEMDGLWSTNGVLTADCLYFSKLEFNADTQERKNYIGMYRFSDGSLTYSEELGGLFSDSDYAARMSVGSLAVDGDGYVCFTASDDVMVLDAALKRSFFVRSPEWIRSLTSRTGTVYAETSMAGMIPLDRETKSFGEAIVQPGGGWTDGYFLGEGYDLFYTTDEGLFGYTPAEKTDGGTETAAEPVLLFSFANSDLYAENLTILAIAGPDCVIASENGIPTIYSRSEDIDLSEITVLEIAYTHTQTDLPSLIVQFNQSHDDVRLIAKDYSVYNTPENYNASEQKLVQDMLNGLYQPDIVTGISSFGDVMDRIYENHLYTDLYAFMDGDSAVARDDLLDSVKRMLETEDGELWAIGPSFSVQTVLGTREKIGSYTDGTGWTLTELLDLAESLPEETELLRGLNRQNALTSLLGAEGYGMFIDRKNGTCDFENAEFIRLLEYLSSLPDEAEGADTGSPVSRYSAEDYLLYHNGQIVLKETVYYGPGDWLEEEIFFNTKDVVRAGYPTDGSSNGAVLNLPLYVTTPFCEAPETAWSFIESILTWDRLIEEDFFSFSLGRSGFPVLKSVLREKCRNFEGYQFDFAYNGVISKRYYTEENWALPMNNPGIRRRFTAEETEAMIEWLNDGIGTPAGTYTDAEITEIVTEEITGYLGGAKTAADCARIIQSRVSIWLAEHQ